MVLSRQCQRPVKTLNKYAGNKCMKTKTTLFIALILVGAGSLYAYRKISAPLKAPFSDARQTIGIPENGHEKSIKIAGVSPDIHKPLRAGAALEISVDTEYLINQQRGSVFINIQDHQSVLATVSEPITQGTGKTTLRATITVPSTDSIQVFSGIMIEGQSETQTVDMREYIVSPH